jgi:hypothetical protein
MSEQTTVTRTEWGVRWPGDEEIELGAQDELDADGGKTYAERVAHHYRHDGAELVQREVRYGAWTAAK